MSIIIGTQTNTGNIHSIFNLADKKQLLEIKCQILVVK